MMRVVRLHGIHDFRLSNEPRPIPKPDEQTIQVSTIGICGSDSHWYHEGGIGGTFLSHPLILGHEFAGILVDGANAGRRVTVDPGISCGECEACREGNPNLCPDVQYMAAGDMDGAMREFLAWPKKNIYLLPDNVSDEEGAFVEPISIALHTVKLEPIHPGMTVGIYGSGPIGLLILQLAVLSGATRIFVTDKLESRLTMAQSMGASDVFLADGAEAKKIWASSHNRGVDIAFEAAGENAAVETAVNTSKYGGKVVIVGITSDNITTFSAGTSRRKGLTFKIVRRMKHVVPTAINLLASKKLNVLPLVTHRYPFDQYQQAFDMAASKQGIKVMMQFDQAKK
jgi:L-iditol 2-dehydrogenase